MTQAKTVKKKYTKIEDIVMSEKDFEQYKAEYFQKWWKIQNNTDDCDFEKAKVAIRKCYELSNAKCPENWVICDSPFSAAIVAAVLKEIATNSLGEFKKTLFKFGKKRLALKRTDIPVTVVESACVSLCENLGNLPGIYNYIVDQLNSSSLNETMNRCLEEEWQGSADCVWFSTYEYYRDHFNIEPDVNMETLMALAKDCSWWAPYDTVTIMQRKYNQIHYDENDRLHNESGPAFSFRDGVRDYYVHGVCVDEQIIMAPETQTIKQIRNEKNEEIRRIRIERFGWERYLNESGAVVVDKQRNDIENTIECLMKTKTETVLIAHCPSTARVYALQVANTVKTCSECQEWLYQGGRNEALGPKTRIIGRS